MRGVAQRVEEASAAARVAPALGVHAPGVVAHVEVVGPVLRVDLARPGGAGDVRLAAVDELRLRALAAVRTADQEHGACVP